MNKNRIIAGTAIAVSTLAISVSVIFVVKHFTDDIDNKVVITNEVTPLPTYTPVPTKTPPRYEETDRDINSNGSSTSESDRPNTSGNQQGNIPSEETIVNKEEDKIVVENGAFIDNVGGDSSGGNKGVIVKTSDRLNYFESYDNVAILYNNKKDIEVIIMQTVGIGVDIERIKNLEALGLNYYIKTSTNKIPLNEEWNKEDGLVNYQYYVSTDSEYNPTVEGIISLIADDSISMKGYDINYLYYYHSMSDTFYFKAYFMSDTNKIVTVNINSNKQIDVIDYLKEVMSDVIEIIK